jgi:hypothetical protein
MIDIVPILDAGNSGALKSALDRDPSLAVRPVGTGAHTPWPLHAVCDRVFDGRLKEEAALDLVRLLLDAGADVNAVHGANGDDMLIAAASLSAPRIGIVLIEAGANVLHRGLFGATALHWAAMLGLPTLTAALIDAGADTGLRDDEHGGTPLAWAVQGRVSPPAGNQFGQVECARQLIGAGMRPDAGWRDSETLRADPVLYDVLFPNAQAGSITPKA